MYWEMTEDTEGAIERAKVAYKGNYYGTKVQFGITKVPERTAPVVFLRWDENKVFFTTLSKMTSDLIDSKEFQRSLHSS